MSIMSLALAELRISVTDTDSPLAVFRHPLPGHVEVVFAHTARTQEKIAQADPALVGVFHRGTPPGVVHLALAKAGYPEQDHSPAGKGYDPEQSGIVESRRAANQRSRAVGANRLAGR